MVKPVSIAFVRQRYAQDGGAERFVSRALEALRSRNVSLTLVTREWRGGEGVDVITCNPFYLGRLWRDWSGARAVRASRYRAEPLPSLHQAGRKKNVHQSTSQGGDLQFTDGEG